MVYIYTLSSTRDLNDIHYVGKTVQPLKRRLQAHISDAKRAKRNGYSWNKDWNWINSELDARYEIIIQYLDELDVSNSEDWEWLECYWIAQCKVWGFNLNNMTNGGDGNKGQIFSRDAIEKRAAALRGKKRSEEARKAISKGKIGIKLTDEHKESVRKAIVNLQGKAIKQFDISGNFIKEWTYIKEAADFYNTTASNISKCCKRDSNHNTCAGYIWRYSDDKTPVMSGISIRKLQQFDLSGNLIKEWNTATEAAKTLDIAASGISYCCNGKVNQYKGFVWKFSR